ncbi:MAG: hypothetical protein A2902_02690 [Elusimicrobia bacterium RIFCSPLOWO2_01_FULL_64_13]|nr:MAG: hypothetical protein A2902_02690 [Elusimicrobia bacterium RIFCSPLOWO2_01_FULL_64_13]
MSLVPVWAVPLAAQPREVRQGGFKFINPLLECEDFDPAGNVFLQNFKYKVQEFVDRKTALKSVIHISVYFRDMNNGPTFGINADEGFVPASLLKVPLMMAYFKVAEEDPDVLDQKILYKGPQKKYDIEQYVSPGQTLKKGRSYSVEDLITRMIVYSDNQAAFLVYRKSLLDRLFTDLGMVAPGSRKPRGSITVKEYSSFFRILFNSTYLNRYFSERALSQLSKSEFKEGLLGGVPQDIMVAHKFGERVDKDEKQLHDCGIVYHPRRPYLLCVMTRGDDFEELEGVIRGISALVYQEVDVQYRDSPPSGPGTPSGNPREP